MKTEGNFLAVSILVAALILAGTLLYLFGPEKKGAPTDEPQVLTGEPPPIGDDYVLGDANAPVTIIEFGDYQCPFCGRFFSQTEPKLRKNYIETGKAKFVYKDLAFLGQESTNAALAANCAGEQGKFWGYHDLLFEAEIEDGAENNGNLNKNLFLSLARELNLNEGNFASCFDSKKYADEIKGDLEEATSSLGQPSTPSTFINNQFIAGAAPYEDFASAIESELKSLR